jgi:flagellar FliL protein
MSSTATVTEAPVAPSGGGKKKLIILIAAALVVLGGGGAGALMLLKKKPDVEADADAEADAEHAEPVAKAVPKRDPKVPPVFVPLDHFTVNLADRDAERYAQIAVTLEIEDPKTGELIKQYMPAIRNNILMAIADRTAGELMAREGKALLADRIKRETSRALGYDVPEDDEAPADAGKGEAKGDGKKKKKKPAPQLPVRAVHFSNFIIQ